ncbi:MAG TPA: phosphoglycerate kinase, partial [Patescibacteria group bacterium]|nr:phosphoglycerate kinase [Patescibacteria group bacterium]
MKAESIREGIPKIRGKTVFLRVDFNVPIENNKIQDEQKITAALPTIRFLLRYDCSVVIATHLGRPKGKKVKKYSTEILAQRLAKLLGENRTPGKTDLKKYKNIKFIDDCIGNKVKKEAEDLKPREILFLENLRFHPGEKKNDKKFAKKLAGLGEVYINNAFSVCHRKHASVTAIKQYLPSFAGFLIEKEIEHLERIDKPQKPLITVMGGSKVSTKVNLIKRLAQRSQKILLGGALANNFLSAQGIKVGRSLTDKESIAAARDILKSFSEKIMVPVDVVVAADADQDQGEVKDIKEVAEKDKILDIGPETIRLYSKHIKKANTIIWNGPMGLFENDNFKHGSVAIARVIASRSTGKAFGVAGGGETVEVLKMSDMMDHM